ncbi:terminase small subunit [Subtercola sp. RTI3]|uniref:terminase small subunit n=1 Tax=Subtercola sp. RTI3 TaxID=3048639 RepID=UPI002B2382E4|nr:terminase small subunit [Subtercola sp. RTI3]MEA9985649.1 terminase small subunit [Subtercola sp. RTI3]
MAEPETPAEENEDTQATMGRPLLFKNSAELQVAINSYFDDCDPHIEERMVKVGTALKGNATFALREVMTEQKPYLMSGLAYHLKVDRKTLLNYGKREDFFLPIQDAKARLEAYTEGQLYTSAANGAKFSLNNNFDQWVERSAIDHTTKDKPITALVEFIGGGSPDSQDPVSS